MGRLRPSLVGVGRRLRSTVSHSSGRLKDVLAGTGRVSRLCHACLRRTRGMCCLASRRKLTCGRVSAVCGRLERLHGALLRGAKSVRCCRGTRDRLASATTRLRGRVRGQIVSFDGSSKVVKRSQTLALDGDRGTGGCRVHCAASKDVPEGASRGCRGPLRLDSRRSAIIETTLFCGRREIDRMCAGGCVARNVSIGSLMTSRRGR